MNLIREGKRLCFASLINLEQMLLITPGGACDAADRFRTIGFKESIFIYKM